MAKKKTSAKISKLMVWPSRTIGLPNYSSVTLNAGVEIVFDEPIDIDGEEVAKALEQVRPIIREEFKRQYAPYLAKKV